MRFGWRIRPEDVWTALTWLAYVELVATVILLAMGVRWWLSRRQAQKSSRDERRD